MVDIKYCPECSTEKSVGDFYKNKARPDGLQSLCKVCLNVRNKARWEAKKDSHRKHMREYAKKNRGNYNAYWSKRRAAKIQATPAWANDKMIASIYRIAKRMSYDLGPHHVDHIVPLQGENVCGLHVENNLQILPAKANISKGNRYQEFDPAQDSSIGENAGD